MWMWYSIELQEYVLGELCTIVRFDQVWYPKAVDNIGDELYDLFGSDPCDRPCLDPFCELINRYQNVHVAP